MIISAELLNRYFKGLCTPEEKLLVAQYLNETEELPESLLNKREWDDTPDAVISEAKTEEMFKAVRKQTISKVHRLKWLKILSAAAVLLAVLAIGFLSLNRQHRNLDMVKNKEVSPVAIAAVNWKSVVNYTEQVQSIILPDHSEVKIYPGGELRYTVPFINQKREIYLKGKVFFQVTKDKKHPFVVYAKGISTTALGTSFTITAPDNAKLIKVELHTGKVWVKNIDAVHQILPFSKILMPGNALVYNTLVNTVKVTNSKSKQENRLKELTFTQAPLSEVFAKLQLYYKVKITCNVIDVQEMSFTGTLKLTQPIHVILKEITELNKLNQTKTTEGYLISK